MKKEKIDYDNLDTVDPILEDLEQLNNAMGDEITLKQGLTIAKRFNEEVEKVLKKGVKEDSYDLQPHLDKVIKEVLG